MDFFVKGDGQLEPVKKGGGSPQQPFLEEDSHRGCTGCAVPVQTATACGYTYSPMAAVDVPRYKVR